MEEHENSRVIFIRRSPTSLAEKISGNDSQIKAYFDTGNKSIGSFWPKGSTRPATGLTIGEEDLIMPFILNMPANDRDFRMKVTEYFHAISTFIEPLMVNNQGGKRLEIGLSESNDKVVSSDNLPLMPEDYIRYRHARIHPLVAASLDDAFGNSLKQFYIFNPKDVMKKVSEENNIKDDAMVAYLEVKGNLETVKMYLLLLKVRPENYVNKEIDKLRELAVEKPQELLNIYKDSNKEFKYLLQKLVINRVLKTVGTRVLLTETEEIIGNTIEEAILYLRDPKNSKQLSIFKGQLQDIEKKEKSTGSSLASIDAE